MNEVFVYGTLLSGQHNNRLLSSSTLLGTDEVGGIEMHDLGPFPACVASERSEKVVGEVWEVSDETLQRLDYLEGHPTFYKRVQIQTKFGMAWVYLCKDGLTAPLIPSGDWKKYREAKDVR